MRIRCGIKEGFHFVNKRKESVKPIISLRDANQFLAIFIMASHKRDLFAGKLHAILMRSWGNRIKGRDYYEFVWYLARGVPGPLKHLQSRLT